MYKYKLKDDKTLKELNEALLIISVFYLIIGVICGIGVGILKILEFYNII